MTKQRITDFCTGYALPDQPTSLRLSKGLYSLSSRSNVPYVQFTGSNGYTKTISWGEWAEVPCDQMVTIRNVSAHGGDIYINSGVEPDPLPARITVPVVPTPPTEFTLGAVGWVDTRRAKRAYFVTQYDGALGASQIVVYGVSAGSHRTANQITAGQGPGFIETHGFLINVGWPPIPLGYNSMVGDDTRPHLLLDKARLEYSGGPNPMGPSYYLIEYR